MAPVLTVAYNDMSAKLIEILSGRSVKSDELPLTGLIGDFSYKNLANNC